MTTERRKITHQVEIGGGAVMTIPDPQSYEDGGPEWIMRYGDPMPIRYTVASLIESYDYLLSPSITTTEAVKRVRKLRQSYAALLNDMETTYG